MERKDIVRLDAKERGRLEQSVGVGNAAAFRIRHANLLRAVNESEILVEWTRERTRSTDVTTGFVDSTEWNWAYEQVNSTPGISLPHPRRETESWHRCLGLDWTWAQYGADDAGNSLFPFPSNLKWLEVYTTIGIIFPFPILAVLLFALGWFLAQLPQFSDQNGSGDSATAISFQKSSLHFNRLQRAWQCHAELVQQDRLMFSWLGDTSFAEGLAATGGQDHIHRLDGGDLIQHFSRLVSQAG